MAENVAPKTLQDAIKHYADLDVCQRELVEVRWPDGVQCPTCGSKDVRYLPNQRRWRCRTGKHARMQFSAKVGTIFEDSPIGLDKWFVAIWLIGNCKNGVSSYEIARAIGVTQKTAWFMLHRIRLAMQTRSFGNGSGPMSGHVEADETYIGGKARNMHKAKRDQFASGHMRRWAGKVAVMGLLERHGRDGQSIIRTEVVPDTRRRNLQQHLRTHVKMDGKTTLYTDDLPSYRPVTPKGWMPSDLYIHKVIDHAEKYVDGQIHTNGLENYWSLLKRMLRGTYVSVEPFHLFRYLDEQAFRFNSRKATDAERFRGTMSQLAGRRLTYAELTGAQTQRDE